MTKSVCFHMINDGRHSLDVLRADESMRNMTHTTTTRYEVTESLGFRLLFSTLLVFMLFVSVAGGSFVCYVIKKHSLLKKRIWIYLFILAVSDIATAFSTIPVMFFASIDENILHTRWVCKLNGFSMTFCCLWSINTLVIISVDKYITLAKPFQALQRDGNRPVIAFLFVIFSLALCLAGAPLIGFSEYTHLKCRKWCVMISRNWEEDLVLSLWLSLCGYVIPVVVIVYSSVGIYLVVKRQRSARLTLRCPSGPDGLIPKKDILVKTVIFLTCAFLLCWTPSLFMILLGMSHIPIPLWYSHLSYFFLLLQGNINPIIYCFKHKCFKQEMRRIFLREDDFEPRSRGGTVTTLYSRDGDDSFEPRSRGGTIISMCGSGSGSPPTERKL